MPSGGFTTNRAILDIADELQRDISTTPVLKCDHHVGMECVLVCITCVTGLCVKCLKQSSHQGHQLEELSDAKFVLRPKFNQKLKDEQSVLEEELKHINETPYSVQEAEKLQADLKAICGNMVTAFQKWKNEHVSFMEDLKRSAVSRENDIQSQRGHLQSLIDHRDINVGTLISKLKMPSITGGVQVSELPKSVIKYNFTEKAQTLLREIQSALSNQNSLSSKILAQTHLPDMKPCSSTPAEVAASRLSEDPQAEDTEDAPQAVGTGEAAQVVEPESNIQTSRPKIPFKKVVHDYRGMNDSLIFLAKDELICYDCKTGACDKLATDSPEGKQYLQWIHIWPNVMQSKTYKKYIDEVIEFYLST